MARRALVPAHLRQGPFTLEAARLAGLSENQLRGASWRRVERGVDAWAGLPRDRYERLLAIGWRLPVGAAFSGPASAFLHRLDVDPGEHPEVTVPEEAGRSVLGGASLHRAQLDSDEIVIRRGLPVTTVPRTLADTAKRQPLVEAVVVADAALHCGLTDLVDMKEYVAARSGRKGIAIVRRVVDLAEPAAESPMETRLRLLLVLAGLPPPAVQVSLRHEWGGVLGRVDLYYPAARLAIEYDGEVHRGRMVSDDRRQNLLINAGYRVLRFTAVDMRDRGASVVGQVRAALEGRFVGEPANWVLGKGRFAGEPA